MDITPNTFCPQLFNVRDTEAMMRPDENTVGHYNPKDAEYEPPEYFTRKRDKAVRLLKKIAVGLSIAAMFALVVANEIANARMTEAFYG